MIVQQKALCVHISLSQNYNFPKEAQFESDNKIYNFFALFSFLSLSSLLPLISMLLPSHRYLKLHHSSAVALRSHSGVWRLAMAAVEVALTQV